jgi:hypothetical protein
VASDILSNNFTSLSGVNYRTGDSGCFRRASLTVAEAVRLIGHSQQIRLPEHCPDDSYALRRRAGSINDLLHVSNGRDPRQMKSRQFLYDSSPG